MSDDLCTNVMRHKNPTEFQTLVLFQEYLEQFLLFLPENVIYEDLCSLVSRLLNLAFLSLVIFLIFNKLVLRFYLI